MMRQKMGGLGRADWPTAGSDGPLIAKASCAVLTAVCFLPRAAWFLLRLDSAPGAFEAEPCVGAAMGRAASDPAERAPISGRPRPVSRNVRAVEQILFSLSDGFP